MGESVLERESVWESECGRECVGERERAWERQSVCG